jgi:hypothetical protein
MKQVVSVSLGASSGNLRVEAEFLGERFLIEREGTDGDLGRAVARIGELDGKVDAIGLGGTDAGPIRVAEDTTMRHSTRVLSVGNDRDDGVRWRAWSLRLAFVALLLLATPPVSANDMGGMEALGRVLTFLFGLLFIGLPLYTIGVAFLEGLVIQLSLEIGYRKALEWAAVANIFSTFSGLIWMFAAGEPGWKVALGTGQTERLALLLFRSYIVTVAEEAVAVALLAHKTTAFPAILRAVGVANVVSYAATVALLLAFRHLW